MSRPFRPHAPRTVHHLISRFVNRAYRVTTATERAAYLDRVPTSLSTTDWRLASAHSGPSHDGRA